jgi:hypothetical protein
VHFPCVLFSKIKVAILSLNQAIFDIMFEAGAAVAEGGELWRQKHFPIRAVTNVRR